MANQSIQITFDFGAPPADKNHPGFNVDNIVVKNSRPAPLPYGDINSSGGVNLDDILCMFACFAGNCTCAGGVASADIWPCARNGAIDLDDIFKILTAFPCTDPCP